MNKINTDNVINYFLLIIPLLGFLKITFPGTIFLTEIIYLLLFPLCLIFYSKKIFSNNQLRYFIFFSILYLIGLFVSDLINNNALIERFKGYVNIILFTSNTIVLCLLVNHCCHRFLLLCLSMIAAQIFSLIIDPNIFFLGGHLWKHGYGFSITLLVILLTYFLPRVAKIVVVFILGLVNLYLGFRSLGGICIISSLIYMIPKNNYKSAFFALILSTFILSILYQLFIFFSVSHELLYINQFQSGSFGPIISGRQEFILNFFKIIDNPIIGLGSFPLNYDDKEQIRDLLDNYGYHHTPVIDYFDYYSPLHSHLLGGWVQGGILSSIIWFWFLFLIFKSLILIDNFDVKFRMIFLFLILVFVWKIFFANFIASARLYDVLSIIPLFILLRRKSKSA